MFPESASVCRTDACENLAETASVCATDARKELLRSGDNQPFVWGEGSPPGVSHSRPIFMSSRNVDSEMAIWDCLSTAML